ncbi:hypothetical protein B7463_g6541, partial [Scytalidium lignicola]
MISTQRGGESGSGEGGPRREAERKRIGHASGSADYGAPREVDGILSRSTTGSFVFAFSSSPFSHLGRAVSGPDSASHSAGRQGS